MIVRRRWNAAVAFLVCAIVLIALSTLVFGWHNNLDYIRVLSSLSRKAQSHYGNQSMFGALNRVIGNGENISYTPLLYTPYIAWVYRTTLITGLVLNRGGVAVPVGQAARIDGRPGRDWAGIGCVVADGVGAPLRHRLRHRRVGMVRVRVLAAEAAVAARAGKLPHAQCADGNQLPRAVSWLECAAVVYVFRRAVDARCADAAGAERDEQRRRAGPVKKSAAICRAL